MIKQRQLVQASQIFCARSEFIDPLHVTTIYLINVIDMIHEQSPKVIMKYNLGGLHTPH
jgi:hypothetical protein